MSFLRNLENHTGRIVILKTSLVQRKTRVSDSGSDRLCYVISAHEYNSENDDKALHIAAWTNLTKPNHLNSCVMNALIDNQQLYIIVSMNDIEFMPEY